MSGPPPGPPAGQSFLSQPPGYPTRPMATTADQSQAIPSNESILDILADPFVLVFELPPMPWHIDRLTEGIIQSLRCGDSLKLYDPHRHGKLIRVMDALNGGSRWVVSHVLERLARQGVMIPLHPVTINGARRGEYGVLAMWRLTYGPLRPTPATHVPSVTQGVTTSQQPMGGEAVAGASGVARLHQPSGIVQDLTSTAQGSSSAAARMGSVEANPTDQVKATRAQWFEKLIRDGKEAVLAGDLSKLRIDLDIGDIDTVGPREPEETNGGKSKGKGKAQATDKATPKEASVAGASKAATSKRKRKSEGDEDVEVSQMGGGTQPDDAPEGSSSAGPTGCLPSLQPYNWPFANAEDALNFLKVPRHVASIDDAPDDVDEMLRNTGHFVKEIYEAIRASPDEDQDNTTTDVKKLIKLLGEIGAEVDVDQWVTSIAVRIVVGIIRLHTVGDNLLEERIQKIGEKRADRYLRATERHHACCIALQAQKRIVLDVLRSPVDKILELVAVPCATLSRKKINEKTNANKDQKLKAALSAAASAQASSAGPSTLAESSFEPSSTGAGDAVNDSSDTETQLRAALAAELNEEFEGGLQSCAWDQAAESAAAQMGMGHGEEQEDDDDDGDEDDDELEEEDKDEEIA